MFLFFCIFWLEMKGVFECVVCNHIAADVPAHRCIPNSWCKLCSNAMLLSPESLATLTYESGVVCDVCERVVSIDELYQEACGADDLRRLNAKTTELFLRQHACHRKCTNIDCQTSYLLDVDCDATTWTCPICNDVDGPCRICSGGGTGANHTIANCPSKKAFAFMPRLMTAARVLIDTWMRKCMACPGCATVIYKVNGCNHMKCTRCDTDFCWKCGTAGKNYLIGTHTCPVSSSSSGWKDIGFGMVLVVGGFGVGMGLGAIFMFVARKIIMKK